ncbi:hypothetical protein [Streptomyces roseolus]|uniref:hypothetical protein n=1 Tax=Streptomyces roseolus TaxID=67358 RepID=UPI003F4CECA6
MTPVHTLRRYAGLARDDVFSQRTVSAPGPHSPGTAECTAGPERPGRPSAGGRAPSAEAEPVALDVLRHEARLALAVRLQRAEAYGSEHDRAGALRLQRGEALRAHGAAPFYPQ